MKKCIICDLDGTLALYDETKKSPYNRDFENDECSEPVRWLLQMYNNTHPENVIFFFSGRDDKYHSATLKFLEKHFKHPEFSYSLAMRKNGDNRNDVLVKEEMYNKYIKDQYIVDFVIDDRLRVCRLWNSLGLFIFNVNQSMKEF